jgi:hypothetical protein
MLLHQCTFNLFGSKLWLSANSHQGVIGVFIVGSSGNHAGLLQRAGIVAPLTHRQELKQPSTKRETVAYVDRLHA